jgi:inner membrane protein
VILRFKGLLANLADSIAYERGRLILPLIAAGVVIGLDLLISSRQWPVPVLGVLDETGHVLTAAVLLAALPRSIVSKLLAWALLGSVAIDLDHLPLYTFAPEFIVGGRPPTHSLATVLVMAGVGLVFRKVRVPLLGLALGVLLHFVRDVATGSSVPLLWPLSGIALRVPYGYFCAVLLIAAAVGARNLQSRRPVIRELH